MRKDIDKVVFERQRRGHKNGEPTSRVERRSIKQNLRSHNDDSQIFDTKKSIKKHIRSIDRKENNENLNYLRRFLVKNIGRPWNKVYSEICKELHIDKALNRNILESIKWMVQQNIRMKDGVPYIFIGNKKISHDGYVQLKSWSRVYDQFYVNPDTGLLCKTGHSKRNSFVRSYVKDQICIPNPDNKLLVWCHLHGIWYEVTCRLPNSIENDQQDFGYWDNKMWVQITQHIVNIPISRHDLPFLSYRKILGSIVFPISKRQMNSVEIKRAKKLLHDE